MSASEESRVAAMLQQAGPILDRLRNRWWRYSHLHTIKSEAGQAIRFVPNWCQTEVYRGMHYRNKIVKVRKLGISTGTEMFIGDYVWFAANKRAGIVDATLDDAKKKLEMIKFSWEMLDSDDFPERAALGKWIKAKSGMGLRLLRDSREELAWNNGSSVYADVSLRGDTPQILHVSELGIIAKENPQRAAAIVAGSFNSVAIGNVIIDESTHEGGRYGVNYDYIRKAEATIGKPLTPLDWKLFFFPWWKEPKYRLPLVPGWREQMTAKAVRYFETLERVAQVKLTDEQKFWWMMQESQPYADMAHQFPGTLEEALTALSEEAIYKEQMAALRAAGRVCNFPVDEHAPIDVFFDIGFSDFTSAWPIQRVARDILLLNFYSAHNSTVGQDVGKLLEWQQEYRRPIRRVYLPHDADNKTKLGKSVKDLFRECGVVNITVVPRTPDIWTGIKHARSLLPKCYIHATNCEKDFVYGNERRMPSGLGCLEGYRKRPTGGGLGLSEEPVHDEASHGADAFRTFAEADLRGMLEQSGPRTIAANGLQARSVGVGESRREPLPDPRLNGASGASVTVRSVRD